MPLLSPRASRTSEGSDSSAGSPRAGSGKRVSGRLSSFLRSPKPANSSDDLEAESAATVVQARLRGNKARKQQEADAGAVTAVQARMRGKMSRKAEQAKFKAEQKAKKEVEAKEAASKSPAGDVTSPGGKPGPKKTGASTPKVNDHDAMVEAEHATTVMQAGLRGYIARRRSLCQHATPHAPNQGQHARRHGPAA